MQPTAPHGKLVRLLTADSLHFSTAQEIESIFNIDASFPALKNLIEELLSFLPNIYSSDRQTDWLAALIDTHSIGTTQSWRSAPKIGSDQNPLNQRFGHYPLAAFLLQDSNKATQSQAQGLKLFFMYVLLQRQPDNHGLTSHADTLRLGIRRNSKELKVLQSLPAYEDDFHDYHEQLKVAVKNGFNSTSSSALLNTLRTMLEMAPNHAPRAIPTKHVTTARPLSELIPAPTRDDVPYDGVIARIRTNSGNPRLAEPPEFIDYFEANLYPEDNTDDKEAASPQLFDEFSTDFQASTSEYWLRRHHRLAPTDWGRLTPPEKNRVASFINEGLHSSGEQEKVTAGLIGTMYITGMSLDELFQASTGPNQVFSAIGSYIREIRKPENGFMPNDAQLTDLQPTAERLLLQLPSPICEWVAQLCQRNEPNLGQCLGIDLETISGWVKDGCEKLRDNGRFSRIRLERIPAALALETTIRFRDPIITFLLTARQNQAAPKLSYYVACPVDDLVNAYNLITTEMLCP